MQWTGSTAEPVMWQREVWANAQRVMQASGRGLSGCAPSLEVPSLTHTVVYAAEQFSRAQNRCCNPKAEKKRELQTLHSVEYSVKYTASSTRTCSSSGTSGSSLTASRCARPRVDDGGSSSAVGGRGASACSLRPSAREEAAEKLEAGAAPALYSSAWGVKVWDVGSTRRRKSRTLEGVVLNGHGSVGGRAPGSGSCKGRGGRHKDASVTLGLCGAGVKGSSGSRDSTPSCPWQHPR